MFAAWDIVLASQAKEGLMTVRNVRFALLAVLAIGLATLESRAGVVYQNTTNATGDLILLGVPSRSATIT